MRSVQPYMSVFDTFAVAWARVMENATYPVSYAVSCAGAGVGQPVCAPAGGGAAGGGRELSHAMVQYVGVLAFPGVHTMSRAGAGAGQPVCALAGGGAPGSGCYCMFVWLCGSVLWRKAGISKVSRHVLAQVLVPASQFVRSLVAARLAADVCGVPTVLIARTDAHSASLLTADIDELDRPFLTGTRTPEGFYGYRHGIKARLAHSCMRRQDVPQALAARKTHRCDPSISVLGSPS